MLLPQCSLLNPHCPQPVRLERILLCSLRFLGHLSCSDLDFSLTPSKKLLWVHSIHLRLPCLAQTSAAQPRMFGARSRSLSRVFRRRELNEREKQEQGKWLLQCLYLPLLCLQNAESEI